MLFLTNRSNFPFDVRQLHICHEDVSRRRRSRAKVRGVRPHNILVPVVAMGVSARERAMLSGKSTQVCVLSRLHVIVDNLKTRSLVLELARLRFPLDRKNHSAFQRHILNLSIGWGQPAPMHVIPHALGDIVGDDSTVLASVPQTGNVQRPMSRSQSILSFLFLQLLGEQTANDLLAEFDVSSLFCDLILCFENPRGFQIFLRWPSLQFLLQLLLFRSQLFRFLP